VVDRISRKALGRDGTAKAPADATDAMEVVGCGQPVPEHQVRVVGKRGEVLGERREGRLEFRGPSATSGYFHNEAKTRELFHDGWLDTGDRGYLADGRVFITGRVKDIVIRAGQHIYPHEVEAAVGELAGICKGAVAMFGVADPDAGTERIVVLAETDIAESSEREELQARAREVAVDAVGVAPDDIVLVQPGTVPKTQSGKIRRVAAKELYLRGEVKGGRRTMRSQMVRLSLAGLAARCFRAAAIAGELSYAIWWWFVIAAAALTGVLAILVLPKLSWRWAAVRWISRMALAAVGATPSVAGGERIPRRGAVLMFNHSSYADAIVLAAVLPGEPVYLAKKEFADQVFTGTMLRRLGVLFIDRYDLAESLAGITTAIAAASRDRVLVIFPEGTFTHRSGLLGFFLGGFKIASEAGLPIVPGVLRGTRSMLRSDQWLPRKTILGVEIGESVHPTGSDFASVLRLRDGIRGAILARCGEADVNELIKPPLPEPHKNGV
jgi:1-acyl-sn-glycerol-3-phosphate acyltransferase